MEEVACMRSLGLLPLIAGSVTAVVGPVLPVMPKIPWLGNPPGDIYYRGKNTEFHFPAVTCIVVSVVLTVVANVALRLLRR